MKVTEEKNERSRKKAKKTEKRRFYMFCEIYD